MEKKVSIIVPVYNAEQYLHDCVESLLAQTYENIEVLLVDDGSTDKSGSICDAYAKTDERIKSFHIGSKGVSDARNKGIEEAEGDYITFVDADDVASEDMVAYLAELLEQTDCDVAGCGYFTFHEKDRQNRTTEGKQKEEASVEVLDGLAFMEKGILQSDTRCWSKLYRRESIGAVSFDRSLTIGEDMLFLLELARQGKRFCRSTYKGYGYYINEKGAMMGGFQDSYMDQITCWQQALALMEKEAPFLTDKVRGILLVSVMLVVGKLSRLSEKERREKRTYAESCRELIDRYGGKKEVLRQLDRGYRIKITFYRWAPRLYMSLYHRKARKG